MGTELMERTVSLERGNQLARLNAKVVVPMGTALRTERVELQHSLLAYLRGAYLERERSWKRVIKQPYPLPFERILYLEDLHVEGESRDPHTMVTVSGLDKRTLVYGVGFAKRSFDAPRIERGTSIALDRAIDDLIRKMAVQLYNGNGSAA